MLILHALPCSLCTPTTVKKTKKIEHAHHFKDTTMWSSFWWPLRLRQCQPSFWRNFEGTVIGTTTFYVFKVNCQGHEIIMTVNKMQVTKTTPQLSPLQRLDFLLDYFQFTESTKVQIWQWYHCTIQLVEFSKIIFSETCAHVECLHS